MLCCCIASRGVVCCVCARARLGPMHARAVRSGWAVRARCPPSTRASRSFGTCAHGSTKSCLVLLALPLFFLFFLRSFFLVFFFFPFSPCLTCPHRSPLSASAACVLPIWRRARGEGALGGVGANAIALRARPVLVRGSATCLESRCVLCLAPPPGAHSLFARGSFFRGARCGCCAYCAPRDVFRSLAVACCSPCSHCVPLPSHPPTHCVSLPPPSSLLPPPLSLSLLSALSLSLCRA